MTRTHNMPLWLALCDRTMQLRAEVEAAILADIERETEARRAA